MCIVAKKAFNEIGEYLQRSRRNDYWDTFSLHLENTEEDPALKDERLASKLASNRNEGQKRLAAVFEKYVKKQVEIKEQVYNGTTTEDESEMDDDKDENEDEDENKDKNNDKNNDILSLFASSNEDNDSVKDVDETNQNIVSSTERNNNKTVNMNQDTNRITLNKTGKIVLQEKCNKKTEVKIPAKENHVSVSKDKNKTITNVTKVSRSPISNAVTISKNATGTDTKTQSEAILTSTINCTDNTDGTEGL